MNAHNATKAHKLVIGIGSNDNAEKNIAAALDALEKKYGAIECSPVYKSAAKTNKASQKNRTYLNLVVSFETNDDIKTCKENLRAIEAAQGRKRNHADVSCDLDLLLFDDLCEVIGNIEVPHRDITQCDFVLRPLADLLPEQQHPLLKKTYKQLWQSFTQSTALEPVEFKWGEELLSIQPPCLSL